MDGCDVVYHVAGVNRMCPRDPAELDATNIGGAVTAVQAAADARVARLVLTSSSAAIGEAGGRRSAPRTRCTGDGSSRAYERSKYLGEREARAAGRERGLEVVTVNPSSVQGPGRTTGSAKLLLVRGAGAHGRPARHVVLDRGHRRLRGRTSARCPERAGRSSIPAIGRGAHDARCRHAAASSHGPAATGRPGPRRLVRAAAPLTGVIARVREDPAVCPATIRALLHGHRYDGSRATRELGLVYRSLEDTLERVLAWYRARGMVPNPAA